MAATQSMLEARDTMMLERLGVPEFYRSLLDEVEEGIYFVDRNERVLYWNSAAQRITGFRSAEVVGRISGRELIQDTDHHGCELCVKGCPLRPVLKGKELRAAGLFMRHREGHRIQVRLRTAPLLDSHGHRMGEARLFKENCETLACVEKLTQLRELTLTDGLTGLGNRRFAEGSISEALWRYEREDHGFGLLVVDVDGLAEVNRTRGQAAGDAALRVVAATLQGSLRSFDMLARWADGEFLAVVEKISIQSLHCLAERMRDLVAGSSVPSGGAEEFGVTVSVGGTMVWEGDTMGRLVGRAEWRLRQAKSEGRGQSVVV
ncbi:MAG: diguanylate cyclase [Acidobacteriota bacterium]